MSYNLRNRHFLTLRDVTPQEIGFLLKLSADLKAAKYAGTEVPRLTGKEIALIFEKDSTRTRVSSSARTRACPITCSRPRSRRGCARWGSTRCNSGFSRRPVSPS